jgi:hypothetical protein
MVLIQKEDEIAQQQRIKDGMIPIDPQWTFVWDGSKRNWRDQGGNIVKTIRHDESGKRISESDIIFSGETYQHADGTDAERLIVTSDFASATVTFYYAGNVIELQRLATKLSGHGIGSQNAKAALAEIRGRFERK